MKKNWLKRILPSVYAAVIIVLAVIALEGFFTATSATDRLSALVDGFYGAGMLLISAFLMRLINRQGLFDMMSYNLMLLLPQGSRRYQERVNKDAYTYTQEKRDRRMKKDRGYPMLWVGLVCMALSVLFLILYNHIQ